MWFQLLPYLCLHQFQLSYHHLFIKCFLLPLFPKILYMSDRSFIKFQYSNSRYLICQLECSSLEEGDLFYFCNLRTEHCAWHSFHAIKLLNKWMSKWVTTSVFYFPKELDYATACGALTCVFLEHLLPLNILLSSLCLLYHQVLGNKFYCWRTSTGNVVSSQRKKSL